MINSVVGYATGMVVSAFVIEMMRKGKLEVLLPWPVLVGVYFITLLMCLGASTLSIYKVTKIDPALVFKS